MNKRYSLGYLAVPGVVALISFQAFSSQWLFTKIEPAPLNWEETVYFNGLVAVVLICYARTITTDPGHIPKGWKPKGGPGTSRLRWCRKCEACKPPRAHHCKICKRCIPKMDHHCPWTINCVSHATYPHFLRFVGYTDVAILYLQYFLYVRAMLVWENRHLPSYHGPSPLNLAHLFVLIIINSLMLFALGILFVRAVWCLVVNTYTIEGWEIERHETLLRRAKVLGGYLDGPDGIRVRIFRQEFPYDIGFWSNIVQGMGTYNVLAWLWPFAASPSIESGLHFETNGFEDPGTSWPPVDPDRMPRPKTRFEPPPVVTHTQGFSDADVVAFRQRQQQDLRRHQQNDNTITRRQVFHKRFDVKDDLGVQPLAEGEHEEVEEGEEGWRNGEGESLADYGVDEEAEFYDEDDTSLADLIAKRQAMRANGTRPEAE